MIVGGKKPIDPTNFKAWKRRIETYIALGQIDEAKAAISQAERFTETLQEKTMITNLYRELASTSKASNQYTIQLKT